MISKDLLDHQRRQPVKLVEHRELRLRQLARRWRASAAGERASNAPCAPSGAESLVWGVGYLRICALSLRAQAVSGFSCTG